MTMNKNEYDEMKREIAEERKMEAEEQERKAREFKKMRDEEIVSVGELRLHIASRVAASLSANMMLDAEAITERAFSIADCMLHHIEKEIDAAG